MKERCRDGCRTSLLIAGVVLVPAIFHTLLPPCHPYITIHFMEMIFSTCNIIFPLPVAGCSIQLFSDITLNCECISGNIKTLLLQFQESMVPYCLATNAEELKSTLMTSLFVLFNSSALTEHLEIWPSCGLGQC